ncbi:MAG TPA: hypothetical protein VHB79_39760 [Polyangiaceae bacterium]|nr:hypothetical protein [Polyangiaceae bacterium]
MMTKWAWAGAAMVVWLSGLAAACGSTSNSGDTGTSPTTTPTNTGGTASGPTPIRIGRECYGAAAVCADNGFCLELTGLQPTSFCSKACSSDSDCSGGTQCGIGPDGSQTCLNSEICSELPADLCQRDPGACDSRSPSYERRNLTCVDGVPTACAAADATQCKHCGCPSGQFCSPGTGCSAQAEVGEPCEGDAGCVSNNCDLRAHVCRVPIGAACTADNCARCVRGNGWSSCSRDCIDNAECNGGFCLGYEGGNSACYPACKTYADPTCPGECHNVENSPSDLFCFCPDCMVDIAARPLGDGCTSSSDCQSQDCYNTALDNPGYCSKGCKSDADCDNGTLCANVPCQMGETGTCGLKCLAPCSSPNDCSSCRHLSSADGKPIEACDAKQADGGNCISDHDCASARCSSNSCLPAQGLANGGVCLDPTQCQSHNCVIGVCHGNATLGEACATTLDCSLGDCCMTGPDAGKCATTCP